MLTVPCIYYRTKKQKRRRRVLKIKHRRKKKMIEQTRVPKTKKTKESKLSLFFINLRYILHFFYYITMEKCAHH